MNIATSKRVLRDRRIARVRSTIHGTSERPRLAVRRSLAHVYAQIIDDTTGKTLAQASDKDVKTDGLKKTEVATLVGTLLAERAQAQKIGAVVFDRRDKRFHGRVKALAEAARAAGLSF
jgi:large subunit ribosomal protein L18